MYQVGFLEQFPDKCAGAEDRMGEEIVTLSGKWKVTNRTHCTPETLTMPIIKPFSLSNNATYMKEEWRNKRITDGDIEGCSSSMRR
jgi:hypothetical protein